jgi:hypothetical protein
VKSSRVNSATLYRHAKRNSVLHDGDEVKVGVAVLVAKNAPPNEKRNKNGGLASD